MNLGYTAFFYKPGLERAVQAVHLDPWGIHRLDVRVET